MPATLTVDWETLQDFTDRAVEVSTQEEWDNLFAESEEFDTATKELAQETLNLYLP